MTGPPNNEDELDDLLTTPTPQLIEFVRSLAGPLLVLGAGGKMGPSLCVLAKRAAASAGVDLDVIAVSRFQDHAKRDWLGARGVETIAADLLDPAVVESLPSAENIVYLIGQKFGTADDPGLTWAVNTIPPPAVCKRFHDARIVALSTGNVYPLVSHNSGGSLETDSLEPVGEYGHAALARERLFDYFSRAAGTRVALIRLNYATDLRYGVPVDIANKILAGTPIELGTGYFNCIWQGDANEMILRALALAASPATAWNLTSTQTYRVRDVASRLGELLQRVPEFAGAETEDALLSNPAALCKALGEPQTDFATTLERTAHWLATGGNQLGKATQFEVRDGRF